MTSDLPSMLVLSILLCGLATVGGPVTHPSAAPEPRSMISSRGSSAPGPLSSAPFAPGSVVTMAVEQPRLAYRLFAQFASGKIEPGDSVAPTRSPHRYR